MSFTSSVLLIIASCATSFAIGKGIDDAVRPEVKSLTSSWLTSPKLTTDRAASFHFVLQSTLNDLFSDNIVSIKFVRRSIALTAIGVSILSVMTFSLFLKMNANSSGVHPFAIVAGVSFAFMLAIAADYASLTKTILIVNSKYFLDSVIRHYLLDLFLSLLIAGSWTMVISVIIKFAIGYPESPTPSFDGFVGFVLPGLISSLIPTLFCLAFVVATLFSKGLLLVGRPFHFLTTRILDVEPRPFTAIGILVWPLIGLAILGGSVIAT
jgi:hypothetical protein